MNAQLTYCPRTAVLSGVVAGRSFRLQTLRPQSNLEMNSWLEAAQSSGMGAARVPGKTLRLSEDAQLEVYDHPAVGPVSGHRHPGGVVWVKLKRPTGFPGDGFHIHGPPHCGNPHCIAVAQNWDSLLSAFKTTRQTTIVVEI